MDVLRGFSDEKEQASEKGDLKSLHEPGSLRTRNNGHLSLSPMGPLLVAFLMHAFQENRKCSQNEVLRHMKNG